MYRTLLAALTVTATIATASAADPVGLIQRLPKDGSWASYSDVGNKDSGSFTIRMVGTTTEDGQKCRWIEMQTAKETGTKARTLSKILVREKDFAPGAKQTPEILRGYRQVNDNAVTELSDNEQAEAALVIEWQKDAKTVKSERVIDYQKGQLKIATATRGKLDHPESELDVTQTIWSDNESPFGTAAMDLSVKAGDVSVYEGKMTLRDHGTGERSALPDYN